MGLKGSEKMVKIHSVLRNLVKNIINKWNNTNRCTFQDDPSSKRAFFAPSLLKFLGFLCSKDSEKFICHDTTHWKLIRLRSSYGEFLYPPQMVISDRLWCYLEMSEKHFRVCWSSWIWSTQTGERALKESFPSQCANFLKQLINVFPK